MGDDSTQPFLKTLSGVSKRSPKNWGPIAAGWRVSRSQSSPNESCGEQFSTLAGRMKAQQRPTYSMTLELPEPIFKLLEAAAKRRKQSANVKMTTEALCVYLLAGVVTRQSIDRTLAAS